MEIFTRKWSELSGGRFDPLYLLFSSKSFLKNTHFEVKSLASVIKSAKTGFAIGRDYQEDCNNGILQIRPTNLDENGILKFDKNIYAPKNVSKEHLIQKGEVLFNNTNSQELVGKTAYFDVEGNFVCSNHITRIQTDTDSLLPKYLCILFNIYQKNKVFFNTCVNWNNQSGVNIDFLKSYLIPLPPKEAQQQIIAIMDNAYKIKQEKEQEAKEILDSIDSYLLGELGIKLPGQESEQNRTFIKKFSEISGNRFDPSYHQKYYHDLEKALAQSVYPLTSLSTIIANFKKGIEVGSGNYAQNKQIPFIRVSDIQNEGIMYEKVEKFITASLYENLQEFKPKDNELLYSKDGTIGLCLKADVSRDYIISGAILRLELKKEVNIDFVQNILASHLLNILANRKAIGAVIKHLSVSEFLSLKIPLPPLNVQEKLVKSIQESKEKATLLQNQAKEILSAAKIDVENMILHNSAAGGGGFNRD
ncbi:restriction endonuclease subunit S [Campylobacter sp. MIT 21-1682]|uniref:restriction endonuclease subunit S n=1 Tax=Campylobacter sp. MIT 21-1682 TaxID=2993734 RepID=UPI00224A88C1|nr:restriction endonuclease subunit S [Campylobacter sp. MIT 21-1682]MCX2751739.1 restriction endonuclease subunit S [Campylobacter sp. MIT 21-1682]